MARSVSLCSSRASCLVLLAFLGGCEGRCPGGSREVGDRCEPIRVCEPGEAFDGGECIASSSSDGGPDAEAGRGGAGGIGASGTGGFSGSGSGGGGAGDGDGDGDGDDASSPADAGSDAAPSPNTPPTVTIDFPVAGVVDRGQIGVRGRVADADGDAVEVNVEGVSADVDAGVFSVSIPLAEGANEIDVQVADDRGGEASDSVNVERRTGLFGSPLDVAVHAASKTAWVADWFVGIIEIDLETGARRVLEGVGGVGNGPALGVAVSADGSLIFASVAVGVGESQRVHIMERARAGGAWSLLANLGESQGDGFQYPMRVDTVRDRLLVAGNFDSIFCVDLKVGPSRGTLSHIATSGRMLWIDYRSETNDVLGSFASIGGGTSLIERIDLGTGTQTTVWEAPSGLDDRAASGVAFGAALAFMADWSRGTIHSLNLANGDLSEHSGPTHSGPQLMLPEAIVHADSTLYVIDSGLSALVSISDFGARTVETRRGTGSGQGFFGPTGLTFDANGDRFFVMDSDPRAGTFNEGAIPNHASVVQVDRRTGNRRIISADGTGTGTLLPWGTSAALHPSGMILATTNRMGILRNTAQSGSIIEIDPASGNRRVVSGATDTNATVGTGPVLDSAIQLIVESETHALVLQRSKIVRVHLSTGNRTIISGPDGVDVQGSGPSWTDAMGFVLDRRTEPPMVYVAARGMVVEVDLNNGNRRIVSDDANASLGPELGNVGGIALDAARERVIVMTPELFRQRDVHIGVSLQDGTRQFLSAEDEASRASGFDDGSGDYSMPSGLYFDDDTRVLWAVDWSLRSLQALDADTGETVLFSHFGR